MVLALAFAGAKREIQRTTIALVLQSTCSSSTTCPQSIMALMLNARI
jgi:hypothetical protein